MKVVVLLSNRIVYDQSWMSSEEEEESVGGNGISMMVPERSILDVGSKRLTRVPGGYFSSN